MPARRSSLVRSIPLAAMLLALPAAARGQGPVLTTLFPAGGQTGNTIEVTAGGAPFKTLHSNLPGLRCERTEKGLFRLTVPADATPGQYDVWGVGDAGVSAPRTWGVSRRTEQLEVEPNDAAATATAVPLNVVVNGLLDKPADADFIRFEARRGQRVVIECAAERIDSRLRAVLELFDSSGRRLAVNRGYFGIDPLIDFHVPADGAYVVKIQDLIAAGSGEHYYRLDIDAGPRVAFALPSVVQKGKPARVTLHGWNLKSDTAGLAAASTADLGGFDQVEVELSEAVTRQSAPSPVRWQPAQAPLAAESFPYDFPGSAGPVVIGLTDVPVVVDRADNHTPSAAQALELPCEVSGQLVAGDERDWFAFTARRGEVVHLAALGQRIGSPVDLQLSLCDAAGERELASFGDDVRNLGGDFPTSHLDPAGRWVCPADGRYLLVLRNLTGGLTADPRRTYRLSVRREEPDVQVVAVAPGETPLALNIRRGGRAVLDLLAFRRRGLEGPIRIVARELPAGIECPDVWLGPGVDRAPLIISADRTAAVELRGLTLEVFVEGDTAPRPVLGGTVVRAGTPSGWGRLTSQIPSAVAGDASIRILADGHEVLDHHLYGKLRVRHAPGGVLDVAVQVERTDNAHQAAVKLIGVGLPPAIPNQTAVIPSGESKGYLSFALPPTLPVGRYSLAVRAETTAAGTGGKVEPAVVVSNAVTFDVEPAAFLVDVDPFAVTQVRRGETIQIKYSAQRLNGFIGKMHTELASPGRVTIVPGLRGRGETFVGQTDQGQLQIVVNADAPLGRQPFLRLFTVGVVEDEPMYFGSRFLPLEIVE